MKKMIEEKLKQAMDRRLSALKTQERHVDHVLRRIQGEQPMKKKTLSLALVFVLVASAGIALAAALTPTIDFFRNLYGHMEKEEHLDYEADLKGGLRMPVGQRWTLGEVQYEWADVIYVEKSRSDESLDKTLYGTVIIRPVPGSHIILKMEDALMTDPYGYNPRLGEEVPPDARSIAQAAEDKGARIIQPKAYPVSLSADGRPFTGEMGGEAGYLPDGSIGYSFVIGPVPRAAEYTIGMRLSNWEVLPDGTWLREEPRNTWLQEVKQVTVKTGEAVK